MKSYQLKLGKIYSLTGEEEIYPLGPWCFVGIEDKFPDWESKFEFPQIFASVADKSAAYQGCLKTLEDIFPSFLVDYKSKFAISEPYPTSFFKYILRPTLIKLISMIVGRMKYIIKFLELHSDKKFIAPPCNKPGIELATDIYCLPELHDWINFSILKFLSSPNVVISTESPAASSDQPEIIPLLSSKAAKTNIKGQVLSFLRRQNKYFRGVYGPTIWEELYLNLVMCFKPRLKPNLDYGPDVQANSNNEFTDSIVFIKNMCLELLSENLSKNFNKNNQSALTELATYKTVQGKILIDQTAAHDDRKILFHAHWLLQGGRIGYAQHGAVYEGFKDHWASQAHEFLGDYFFSWGWVPPVSEIYPVQFRPLPSFELSAIRDSHKESNNHIIYVGSSVNPHYDGILFPEPYSTLRYRAAKQQFLNQLNPEVMKTIQYREMQSRLKTELEDWDYLRKKGYNLPALKGHLISQAIYSRAVIADHYGTVFIQCLSANIPIIIFFGEQDYNLREDIENYFKLFKKFGIFHESPESAAAFLNDNFHSISEWWSTPELQEIRQDFCRKYVYTSDNCLKEWAKALWSLQ